MISIVPDSVSKSRGKQYPSRTRSSGKVMQFPSQMVAHLSLKQQQRHQKQMEARNGMSDLGNGDAGIKDDSQEQNTLSVEVVKALPDISSVRTSGGVIDIDSTGAMSVRIPELEGKDEISGESLGAHVQHISLGPGGELVDHYVVHLTESVDGSSPTIQTAFIPAVSGAQLFGSSPQGMGIQPIAIIEARSFNMAECAGKQILAAAGTNTIMAGHRGDQLEGQHRENVSGYITVTDGAHILGAGTSGLKSDLSDAGKLELPGTSGVENGTLISSHDNDLMVARANGLVGSSESDRAGLSGDCKDESVMVLGSHGLMVSAGEIGGGSADVGGDMMDGALSLFSPPVSTDSYMGGQTYITCSTHLVDYASSQTILHGPS